MGFWTVSTIAADDAARMDAIYGRGVNAAGDWAVSVFSRPLTWDGINRVVGDPAADDERDVE